MFVNNDLAANRRCIFPKWWIQKGSNNWIGPKVNSHLMLCCIHCMNRVNSHNALSIKTKIS